MRRVDYSNKKPDLSLKEFSPEPGVPFVYFLTAYGTKDPFYIGEYGKATGYNVIKRISSHFANSGTLRRVANNLDAFCVVKPDTFSAYIKQLPDKYRDDGRRKSLEAWIIFIVCHEKKIQSRNFCVVRYQAPTYNEQVYARQIINELEQLGGNV